MKSLKVFKLQGVAEYMYKHAGRYKLNPEEMYFLGFNQDIGFINNESSHGKSGANILESLGFSKELCNVIRYHELTPQEYKDLFMCQDYSIPSALVLLWEANIKINDLGKEVGYDYTLESISSKYGSLSDEYIRCKETVVWLRNY